MLYDKGNDTELHRVHEKAVRCHNSGKLRRLATGLGFEHEDKGEQCGNSVTAVKSYGHLLLTYLL